MGSGTTSRSHESPPVLLIKVIFIAQYAAKVLDAFIHSSGVCHWQTGKSVEARLHYYSEDDKTSEESRARPLQSLFLAFLGCATRATAYGKTQSSVSPSHRVAIVPVLHCNFVYSYESRGSRGLLGNKERRVSFAVTPTCHAKIAACRWQRLAASPMAPSGLFSRPPGNQLAPELFASDFFAVGRYLDSYS